MKNLSIHTKRKLKSVLNTVPDGLTKSQFIDYLSAVKVTVPISLIFLAYDDGESQGYLNNRGGCSKFDFPEFIKKKI